MKTAVSIPDTLFDQAEAVAERLHLSRSELYARALRAYVREQDEDAKRRALDDLYAAESSELPTGAEASQAGIASEWTD